jgi:hypothetical protein
LINYVYQKTNSWPIPICRTDESGGKSSALIIFREQSTVKYNKQIQMERI